MSKVTRACIVGLIVFWVIFGAGLFIAAAGGQRWGSFDAGIMAFATIIVAAVVSTGAFILVVEKWR